MNYTAFNALSMAMTKPEVSKLLQKHNMAKYATQETSILPLTAWTTPYELSAECLNVSSGLGVIARQNMSDSTAKNFYKLGEEVKSVLQIKVTGTEALADDALFMRKVNESNARRVSMKTKKPREKTAKGNKRSAGATYVAPSASKLYDAPVAVAAPRLEKDTEGEQAAKRARDAIAKKNSGWSMMDKEERLATLEMRPYKNLHDIVSKVFTPFWDMDLGEDVSVKYAFMTEITRKTCARLGVANYFEKFPSLEQALTLPFIHKKVIENTYSTAIEFCYDFRQMTDNAIAYYGADSPPGRKAAEFREAFEKSWAEAEPQLKY